jgi:hypothetical protein
VKRTQFADPPAMRSHPGSHGRSARDGRPAHCSRSVQTLGRWTKGVDGSDHVHPVLKGNARACQARPWRVNDARRSRKGALSCSREAAGITPLPCEAARAFGAVRQCPLPDPPLDVNHAALVVAFDHVGHLCHHQRHSLHWSIQLAYAVGRKPSLSSPRRSCGRLDSATACLCVSGS